MTSYKATSLGMIRGAVIGIEETVKQQAIDDLAEQGTMDMLEPEHMYSGLSHHI